MESDMTLAIEGGTVDLEQEDGGVRLWVKRGTAVTESFLLSAEQVRTVCELLLTNAPKSA